MRKRLAILFVIIMISGLACATTPKTPKEIYLAARMTFNDALESYIAQKAIASPQSQIQWEAEIEPMFRDAQEALDIWGLAIHSQPQLASYPGMSVTEKERIYNKIKLKLFKMLFRFGILEIEGGS